MSRKICVVVEKVGKEEGLKEDGKLLLGKDRSKFIRMNTESSDMFVVVPFKARKMNIYWVFHQPLGWSARQ